MSGAGPPKQVYDGRELASTPSASSRCRIVRAAGRSHPTYTASDSGSAGLLPGHQKGLANIHRAEVGTRDISFSGFGLAHDGMAAEGTATVPNEKEVCGPQTGSLECAGRSPIMHGAQGYRSDDELNATQCGATHACPSLATKSQACNIPIGSSMSLGSSVSISPRSSQFPSSPISLRHSLEFPEFPPIASSPIPCTTLPNAITCEHDV